jgi:signal transduction histidine kinase
VDLERPTLRLLALIAAVVLPALVVFAVVVVYAPGWVEDVGVGTALAIVGLAALAWSIVVALFGSRILSRDLSGVVSLAERGPEGAADEPDAGSESELSVAQRRLKGALDERNRQIGVLADESAASPLRGQPAEVAARLVAVTRDVTRDPTWLLVILHASDPELLPSGVYDDAAGPPRPVGELERWAAVAEPGTSPGPRFLEGPWGAVVVVDASSGDALTAILLAPWEGRAPPTPAERDLLSLVAQIAGSSIEHALLYHQLQTQTDKLNRLAAVQSDFLRGVTHDLQTPLTSIRALASELGANPELSETARSDLLAMAHQSDRMRRMVGQLLAVSRLEAGALESRQDIFRAEPLVERTWEALRNATHEFSFASRGAAHLVVGDPDRYEQVLWALLDNAVKYSPPGTTVRVELSGQLETDGVLTSHLTVADMGPGMTPDEQEHAFDQFFRGDGARRMVPDGSGIGLYAARGLVGAMHGHLTVTSQPGHGTTFEITLPAEPTDAEPGSET